MEENKQLPQSEQIVNTEDLLTIIHFNDVYDIQPRKDGLWGIVNFQAQIKELKKNYPKALVLFSGDAFSPSALTNIFDGEQMVRCLNQLQIDVACYGNHEFDLDEQVTLNLAKACNFPWVLGNIKYIETKELLGKGKQFIIKQLSCGKKVGIFGVAGEDWLGILGDSYDNLLIYEDYIDFSKRMCKVLKNEHKCDMIIALTHMRVPCDKKLPTEVPEIDLILGAHDHIVFQEFINETLVVKSGDNFKTLRLIHVNEKNKKKQAKYKGTNYDFDTKLIRVPITNTPNEDLRKYVQLCTDQYTKHDRVIGWTDVDLQTRFNKIRTQQTNYGNFVTDLVRYFYDVDAVIINSGGIRIDTCVEAGPLKYSTISNIINDALVVKYVSGSKLLEALEYGCASCPDVYAGSFLQVSGIRFSYDCRKTPRVQEVFVGSQLLDKQKEYRVATHSYMGNGGDGFQMLKQCQYQIDPLASIDMLSLLLKFFKLSDITNDNTLDNLIVQIKNLGEDLAELQEKKMKQDKKIIEEADDLLPPLKLLRKPSMKVQRISALRKKVIIAKENNTKFACIAPTTDGRIKSLYP